MSKTRASFVCENALATYAKNIGLDKYILVGHGQEGKVNDTILADVFESVLGAIYAILAYAGILPMYANIFVKIILSLCMVYIAYNPKTIKGMLKELVVFYLVSFALGGCAFALLYIVRPQDIFMKDGVYIGTYPLKIALLGGITGFIITYIAFKAVKTRISKNEIIYKAAIKLDEKEITINVMLDTGNMLKDPISNSPVVLVEKSKLYDILPNNLLENTKNILGGEWNEEEYNLNTYRTKLRIIPFTSVGKQNGMMVGIKADEIKIITDVDEIINKNAIICVYEKTFSKTGKYSGLIGIDMLEGKELAKV